MEQATIKLYIRFGDIPKDFQSKVHRNGVVLRNEGGVSVWEAVKANGDYFPILPKDANEHTIADYFNMLFSDEPAYLVTGSELFFRGADNEPLLAEDIKVIKQLDYSYYKEK